MGKAPASARARAAASLVRWERMARSTASFFEAPGWRASRAVRSSSSISKVVRIQRVCHINAIRPFPPYSIFKRARVKGLNASSPSEHAVGEDRCGERESDAHNGACDLQPACRRGAQSPRGRRRGLGCRHLEDRHGSADWGHGVARGAGPSMSPAPARRSRNSLRMRPVIPQMTLPLHTHASVG